MSKEVLVVVTLSVLFFAGVILATVGTNFYILSVFLVLALVSLGVFFLESKKVKVKAVVKSKKRVK